MKKYTITITLLLFSLVTFGLTDYYECNSVNSSDSISKKSFNVKVYHSFSSGLGLLAYNNPNNTETIFHLNTGFSLILKELFLGIEGNMSFGDYMTSPNQPVPYSGGSLKIGIVNTPSEKFYITPYVGIGLRSFRETTQVIETEYLTETNTQIFFPLGVDFNFSATSFFGLSIGAYMNVSSNQEAGFRLGWLLGKLK